MDFQNIDLNDCPICHGAGLIEEENGWCVYVSCMDCGCHTAEAPFDSEEERQKAAETVAMLWNIGKVISSGTGE